MSGVEDITGSNQLPSDLISKGMTMKKIISIAWTVTLE